MSKNETRSAVVTGAGSGLGFATAKLLKSEGWTVFGTIIESQSPDELKKLGITPVVVDIADPESTEAAKKQVEEALGDEGLSALINVAGLPIGGLLEGCSPEYIRWGLSVVVEGTINMVRSFLPLLRKYGPARIVNVTTSGTYVPAVFTAPYSICKFAEQGITEVLRYELRKFGIQVCSVAPGGMKTPMTEDMKGNTQKNWDRMGPEIYDIYYEKIHKSLDFINMMGGLGSKPESVAKVILKALNKKKMKITYLAGPMVVWMKPAKRILGDDLFETVMSKMQRMG